MLDANSELDDKQDQLPLAYADVDMGPRVAKADGWFQARFELPIPSMRLLHTAMSTLPNSSQIEGDATGKQLEVTFDYAHLIQCFPDMAKQRLYGERLRHYCRVLNAAIVEFPTPAGGYSGITIISAFEWNPDTQKFRARFSTEATPYICLDVMISKRLSYTRYPLQLVSDTQSYYHWRLWEKVIGSTWKNNRSGGKVTYSIEDLADQLRITSDYPPSKLYRKIIEPALRRFKEADNGYLVEYEKVMGRTPKAKRRSLVGVAIYAEQIQLKLTLAEKAVAHALKKLGFDGDVERYAHSVSVSIAAETIAAVETLANIKKPSGLVRAAIEDRRYIAKHFSDESDREIAVRSIGTRYAEHLFKSLPEEEQGIVREVVAKKWRKKSSVMEVLDFTLENMSPDVRRMFIRATIKHVWPELEFRPITPHRFLSSDEVVESEIDRIRKMEELA